MTLVRAVAIARVKIDRRRVPIDSNNAFCMTHKPRLMVISGLGFGLALVRAGVLPLWAGGPDGRSRHGRGKRADHF